MLHTIIQVDRDILIGEVVDLFFIFLDLLTNLLLAGLIAGNYTNITIICFHFFNLNYRFLFLLIYIIT